MLKDWQIVVLKASEEPSELVQTIEHLGAKTQVLPVIGIEPLTISETQCLQWQNAIMNVDFIFVSSQHAVRLAPPELLKTIAQRQLKILTMGKTTSQSLEAKGLAVFFSLGIGKTSEDLLTESFLQSEQIKNKKVLLLAGEGGRTLIYDTLQARGAKVTWLKVYQQVPLKLHLTPLIQSWKKTEKIGFVAASGNILTHFIAQVPFAEKQWLYHQLLITLSPRIALIAQQEGFKNIMVLGDLLKNATKNSD